MKKISLFLVKNIKNHLVNKIKLYNYIIIIMYFICICIINYTRVMYNYKVIMYLASKCIEAEQNSPYHAFYKNNFSSLPHNIYYLPNTLVTSLSPSLIHKVISRFSFPDKHLLPLFPPILPSKYNLTFHTLSYNTV